MTDAHAPIIGVLEPQAGGDLPGDRPRSPGRVDDPLAQGRVGVQLADLGAGQPRLGRGLRRRGAVDPVRARPTADLEGHGLPAPADPAGDEGGRIPLRQARGDHGPLTGPQAQAPTGAPAAPARRVPGDPMAARRPRAARDARPHRHARGSTAATGRAGALHARIVQPPARGRDRHAPSPPGPGPPGPSPPQASNTTRLRRAAARAPCAHGPHRQSHARPPGPPLHRRVRHAQLPSRRGRRPAIRNQLHRPQAHLISDPHPTRHIDHSSEPVMVQPSPDTALRNYFPQECSSRLRSGGGHVRAGHRRRFRPRAVSRSGRSGAVRVGAGVSRSPRPAVVHPLRAGHRHARELPGLLRRPWLGPGSRFAPRIRAPGGGGVGDATR